MNSIDRCHRWMDRWADDRLVGGCTDPDRWMDGQTDRQMDVWMNGWVNGWADGQMYPWTDGQTDGWMGFD